MSTAVSSSDRAPATEQDSDFEQCVVCCDPMKAVSLGRCNHAVTCAICTMRSRIRYKDTSCPICKAQLKYVFLTQLPRSPQQRLDFNVFSRNKKERFITKKGWRSSIWVDRESQVDGVPLLGYIQSAISMSCKLCNENFGAFRDLRSHLKAKHNGSTICNVCYQADRYFPKELEIFQNEKSLREHSKTHPSCEYCRQSFFGKDELYNHMKRKHVLCELCHTRGDRHVYFQTPQDYRAHLREKHFACHHPECVECMIAFNTQAELTDHQFQSHGARPSRQGRRGQAVITRFSASTASRGFSGAAAQLQGSDGFVMIDDDLPPMYNGPPASTATPDRQPRPNRPLSASTHFPPLPAADPPELPKPNVPKTIQVQLKCPCGHRITTVRVPQGTTPQQIQCNSACEVAKRRARLAEAFNIDTNTYAGAFTTNFSADLVSWARSNPSQVRRIENQLHERIQSGDRQRFMIDDIKRETKRLAIELVDTYGAVGRPVHSSNSIEVVPTNRCALLAKKLSAYAIQMSEEDYNALVEESLKNVLFVENIQNRVDLRSHLRLWQGDYEMDVMSKTSVRLRFRTPAAFKSAKSGLGGGVRDVFTIRCPLPDDSPPSDTSARPTGAPRRKQSAPVREEEAVKEELALVNSFEILSRL